MFRRFLHVFTLRRVVAFVALILLVCLAIPQVWAWSKLRSAKAALRRYHPEEARQALDSCERVWGNQASVRLLACRAAWQDGDFESSVRELREAQRLLGGATDETALEWALLHASAGYVGEVEEFLQRRAEQTPDTAAIIWESLALGYLRVYRTLDAMACVEHWLKSDPKNVRALELRGRTYVAGKGVIRGTEDYRQVLELDPTRADTRWRLSESLISLGSYDEAAKHLEQFAKDRPNDPAVTARLARCYNMLGRGDEARQLIEISLVKYPDDASSLQALGQIELLSRRPVEAEGVLRKAAALKPQDYQTQQLLFQTLQQQGRMEEAKTQLKVAEAVREQAEQLGELKSRKLAEFPLDPALHYEMGKLLIETGYPEVGERWLLTALSLDSNHQPSHAALAAYYEKHGDRTKAGFHRNLANQLAP